MTNTRIINRVFSLISIILVCAIIFIGCKPNEPDLIIPEVTTTEATEIRDTSAVLNGNISSENSSASFDRGFVWNTTGTPVFGDNKLTVGAGNGDFSSFIGNLSPSTEYYTRAYAKTEDNIFYGNITSFKTFDPTGTTATYTDSRDGKNYNTITIGYQVWLSENLKYLPTVNSEEDVSGTSPRYYVYDYHGTDTAEAKSLTNYENYGVLYNWAAASIACPEGWHLPTDSEWRKLELYLGMSLEEANNTGLRGTDEGGEMKSTDFWQDPNTGANNSSGFSARPGGAFYDENYFDDINSSGYWWTNTNNGVNSLYRYLKYNDSRIGRLDSPNGYAYSIRCVKN